MHLTPELANYVFHNARTESAVRGRGDGLSEMTVKVHRAQIMKKMRATSLVDLVRIADRLSVSTEKS